MQFQVPPQLNYNQLQTKAFFSVFKQWPIQPISNGGQYFPGQVIRIFMNALTDGVMDPYRSHFQATVDCDISTLPVGLLQIDNSAQSLIQQLVITSRNRQIQRIIQYGCLAAYLTDIGISELFCQGRQSQGLGYSNIDNLQSLFSNTVTSGGIGTFNYGLQQDFRACYAPGTVQPTIPCKYAFQGSYGGDLFSLGALAGIFRTNLSWLNIAWQNNLPQVWWWYMASQANKTAPQCSDTVRTTAINWWGYATNVRAQYLSNHFSNDYIQCPNSISKYEIMLSQNVQNGTFPAKFTNQTVYSTFPSAQLSYFQYDSTVPGGSYNSVFICPNIPAITGYTTLYSPNFSKGVNQPFISPTVPQCQMQNGVILPTKVPVSRRTFKIPVISGSMGLLLPQNQFILPPLRAFNDTTLEISIDPYAFFTSGYNDIGQYDNVGIGLMQQRAFRLVRLVYNLHTYQFYTPQMDEYLKVSLATGIAVNSHIWQLGNQYQIQNSQSLTNSWQVACNQQALNQILVLFYPLDYQNLSFCRKHFRISNNITKLQLRINMEYYPSQPLSGNGGNPIQLDSTGNNSIFLNQIYMSNGYFFSNQNPSPRINAFNFAINDRCYNVYNTHTYYDPGMLNNPGYVWNQQSVNADTALGMANIHQNRFVGKAAYLFSFQPYSHSKNFLTGIDCRSAKQFDIIFTCNPQSWFPRAQMMLIYTRSSTIFQYGRDGIVNVGR